MFQRKKNLFDRLVCSVIAFTFMFSMVVPPAQAQTVLNLPVPGTMVMTTPGFTPPMIYGVTIHPDNPLLFDFIVGRGDSGMDDEQLKVESDKLIKYFLASLTVPEDQLWVNLSPYEKDRIISDSFGQTTMGRDLLAQDYLLKQLSASLMYPEEELGSEFWDRVYTKAYELYGTTEIPMNTFNKIWVVPEDAVVLEKGNSAYVVDSHLKVMLEEDYVALKANMGNEKFSMDVLHEDDTQVVSGVTSEVVREVLIPEIEREVNEGETFANLRQIYNSVILAAWYKVNLKDSLLGKVYVDQGKTKGVNIEDTQVNQKIYRQYLEAFSKGVYNYIREDIDQVTNQMIPRKYFSGGNTFSGVLPIVSAHTVSIRPNGRVDPEKSWLIPNYKLNDLVAAIRKGDGAISVETALAENPLAGTQASALVLQPKSASSAIEEVAVDRNIIRNIQLKVYSVNKDGFYRVELDNRDGKKVDELVSGENFKNAEDIADVIEAEFNADYHRPMAAWKEYAQLLIDRAVEERAYQIDTASSAINQVADRAIADDRFIIGVKKMSDTSYNFTVVEYRQDGSKKPPKEQLVNSVANWRSVEALLDAIEADLERYLNGANPSEDFYIVERAKNVIKNADLARRAAASSSITLTPFQMKQEVRDLARDHFYIEGANVLNGAESEQAIVEVVEWANEQTDGQIDNIRHVLVNRYNDLANNLESQLYSPEDLRNVLREMYTIALAREALNRGYDLDVIERTRVGRASASSSITLQGPDEETPLYGIELQERNLAKALKSNEGSIDYYDVVFLVVDAVSADKATALVAELRQRNVIPEKANVITIRQPASGNRMIKGNWSAILNILNNGEYSDKIINDKGAYKNIAVILSAGTATRNFPITAANFLDKGEQSAPNGRSYIEQQFRQIMQYYKSGQRGMIITSNDGLKSISKQVDLGDQGIQFLGASLPITNPELAGLGMAEVGEVKTSGKPIKRFVEKAGPVDRTMAFYHIDNETLAREKFEKIERGEEEAKLIPTNWADYYLSIEALEKIKETYKDLVDKDGRPLYLKYGLDTAGDVFEASTLTYDEYKKKKGSNWNESDLRQLYMAAHHLDDEVNIGYVSTGKEAYFVDTGNNLDYYKAAMRLLADGAFRKLLGVPEPANGSIFGPDVVLGEGVEVEPGSVLMGEIYIGKGKIKSGTVIIDAVFNELYTEGKSLIHSAEDMSENAVYVDENMLHTDIFFNQGLRLIRGKQRKGGTLFNIVTDDAAERSLGDILMVGGEVVEGPSDLQLKIDENGDGIIAEKSKISIDMPIDVTAKDVITEYQLSHHSLGRVGEVLTVNGEIREVYPSSNNIRFEEALNSLINTKITSQTTVESNGDSFDILGSGKAIKYWEAVVWPRRSRKTGNVRTHLEERPFKKSFEMIKKFADINEMKNARDRRNKIIEEAKNALNASSPMTFDESEGGKASSAITSAEFTVEDGVMKINQELYFRVRNYLQGLFPGVAIVPEDAADDLGLDLADLNIVLDFMARDLNFIEKMDAFDTGASIFERTDFVTDLQIKDEDQQSEYLKSRKTAMEAQLDVQYSTPELLPDNDLFKEFRFLEASNRGGYFRQADSQIVVEQTSSGEVASVASSPMTAEEKEAFEKAGIKNPALAKQLTGLLRRASDEFHAVEGGSALINSGGDHARRLLASFNGAKDPLPEPWISLVFYPTIANLRPKDDYYIGLFSEGELVDRQLLERFSVSFLNVSPSGNYSFDLVTEDGQRVLPKAASPLGEQPTTSNEQPATKPVGGIDLNPELLDLQIRRDGNGVPLPVWDQPIESMHIEGFLPVIINVTPVTNLPVLLGLLEDTQDDDLAKTFQLDPMEKKVARFEIEELV